MNPVRLSAGIALWFVTSLPAFSQVLCNAPGALAECPATCASLCVSDANFRGSNRAACASAILAKPGSDPQSCSASTPQITVTAPSDGVAMCIEQARGFVPEVNEAVGALAERQAVYNAFFSEMPECAATPKALTKMYDCLVADSEEVNSTFDALNDGGSELDALKSKSLSDETFATYEATFCKLNENNKLMAIDAASIQLRERTNDLRLELQSVSQCRVAYETWIQGRPDICTDFPNMTICPQVANAFNIAQKRDLGRLTERTESLTGVVRDVNITLEQISLLALSSAAFTCTATN